jgi:hypothetical protein
MKPKLILCLVLMELRCREPWPSSETVTDRSQ